MEQEEVGRGKRLAKNPTWGQSLLYAREAERRLSGIKNIKHAEEIRALKTQIENLQRKLDSYQQAA